MLVVEPVLALAAEHMSGNIGNILSSRQPNLETTCQTDQNTYTQSHGGELVVLANGQREYALTLRLRSVEQEILRVKTSPAPAVSRHCGPQHTEHAASHNLT